ncbi:MAG TPA: hypothetical protein VGD40_13465 [Chryseosolibacter sp.]
MTNYQRQKIDIELKAFVSSHLKKPSSCYRSSDIRLYINALTQKIQALEELFNYAPDWAYAMLAEYAMKLNTFVSKEFTRSYQ